MGDMNHARLIPTSGIGTDREAEQRATSALLAVISIVRDFSDTLLSPLGASRAKKATVEAFTEVSIELPGGAKVRPDGLLRVSYGSSVWAALVEVKTGDGELGADQLNNYLAAAKVVDADMVVSISNEIGVAGAHPTPGLKVRSNSKVQIHHYSWTELLAAAVQCKDHAGVDDPEQAWILGELIRYLEHPASGANQLGDMGPSWTTIRDAGREGTIKKNDPAAAEIAARWDQLVTNFALRLSSETGANVTQVLPRASRDPKVRVAELCASLADNATMSGVIRVPGTVGDITITTDLRARQLTAEVTVPAPGDKKARGSVSWLTRQLGDAPDDLTIETFAKNARTGTAAALGDVRGDSSILVPDGGADVAKFVLTARRDAGQGRKAGGRSPGFIDTANTLVEGFYATVVQSITPWVAPAPKATRPTPPSTPEKPAGDSGNGLAGFGI